MVEKRLMDISDIVSREIDRKNDDGDLVSKLDGYGRTLEVIRNLDSQGVEDRSSMKKELGLILEHLSISLSLNHSSLCYEVSLEELKCLLDSYTFQVNLIGDMCIIAFEGNLFLLVPSMTN
ncbi:hypothetical protein M9H77_30499 [Catharanthus roseus]|uniref:Uncharacterized protein n=1 Tax=Catharanthus roseus TaxID=4058 RepID=A0ACC0A026_CATRO|nr:hypothetical protein M9H77_30499 [Catharanthus roseus]